MPYESQSNPMTEIALALAMAFFSIMVLAIISMGGALQNKRSNVQTVATPIKLMIPATSKANEGYLVQRANPATLLIHWGKNFYDSELNTIEDPSSTAREFKVLAISPDLSISDAMKVQESLNINNLQVTTLTKNWVALLNDKKG